MFRAGTGIGPANCTSSSAAPPPPRRGDEGANPGEARLPRDQGPHVRRVERERRFLLLRGGAEVEDAIQLLKAPVLIVPPPFGEKLRSRREKAPRRGSGPRSSSSPLLPAAVQKAGGRRRHQLHEFPSVGPHVASPVKARQCNVANVKRPRGVTAGRLEKFDFSKPTASKASEIVVSGHAAAGPRPQQVVQQRRV